MFFLILTADFMQIIGDRLRALRKENNLTQIQMAEILNVQQSRINRYETGASTPPAETFILYADFFGVSMDYLYGRCDDPKGKLYNNQPVKQKNKPKASPEMEQFKAEEDYLLTTKLFCGHCGALMFGESGTSHTQTTYRYYKCANTKRKKTCHKKPVRKNWVEDLVVNQTMKIAMDDEAIEAIVAMVMDLQDRENTDLPLYEKQLAATNASIDNMLNAIQMGILTRSTKERLEALEATREDLEIKIAKPKITPEFVTFWLHRFRKLDVEKEAHRKMLVNTFVNAVYLYDDKIVVTFNYRFKVRRG